MKKINKTILSLGTVISAIAPIATVVSCGDGDKKEHFNLLPTYTGQADQLIALGVHSDYYPLQLNETKPYGYLTNPDKFMVKQDDDFKAKFKNKIASLLPKRKGVSWWNQDALESDEQGSDPSYWQEKEAGVLLYEHYLLDDNRKVISSSIAPKANPYASVQTNFRASRDPFTRIPKGVFYGWDLSDKELEDVIKGTAKSFSIDNETVSVDAKSASIIKALKKKRKDFLAQDNASQSGESDWLYNDWYFVDSYHRMFLDNKDLWSTGIAKVFKDWLVDSTQESPFTTQADNQKAVKGTTKFDEDVQKLFDASTFQSDEIKGGIGPNSTAHHHPIYEQQEGEVGAAPMFEGAMRDNQLYLFNVAWQLTNLINWGTPYGEQHYDELPETKNVSSNATFDIAQSKEAARNIKKHVTEELSPEQVTEIKKALDNSISITKELKERMNNLKTYFASLGADGKTFGMLTIAPGHGESTIQTMSKYSFLYKELGFTQPIPTNLDAEAAKADQFSKAWNKTDGTNTQLDAEGKVTGQAVSAIGEGSLFNMDDNGWFWTMGETGKIKQQRLERFKGQFDIGVIASRDENYQSEVSGNSNINKALNDLFSTTGTNADDFRVNYDLWNEGLKTPFVMHMILDKVQKLVEDWYLKQNGKTAQTLKAIQNAPKNKYAEATSWGNYFTNTYINS